MPQYKSERVYSPDSMSFSANETVSQKNCSETRVQTQFLEGGHGKSSQDDEAEERVAIDETTATITIRVMRKEEEMTRI